MKAILQIATLAAGLCAAVISLYGHAGAEHVVLRAPGAALSDALRTTAQTGTGLPTAQGATAFFPDSGRDATGMPLFHALSLTAVNAVRADNAPKRVRPPLQTASREEPLPADAKPSQANAPRAVRQTAARSFSDPPQTIASSGRRQRARTEKPDTVSQAASTFRTEHLAGSSQPTRPQASLPYATTGGPDMCRQATHGCRTERPVGSFQPTCPPVSPHYATTGGPDTASQATHGCRTRRPKGPLPCTQALPVPRFHYPASPQTPQTRIPLRLPRMARLLFAGDLMQHKPQVDAARQADGTYDYSSSFACVEPLFRAADLAVVNLETTLAPGPPYTGYPCFRSPAALAEAIRSLGADVCVLANNHCCDGGARGVRTTVEALDRAGVAHTGVFADSADYRCNHPLRLQAGEVAVALLNYTYGTNGLPVPAGVIVNRIDTVRMASDLAVARAGGADVVAVCIHWGAEYARQENAAQRRLAAFLRRQGADLVIGSHPHVVQPFHAGPAGAVFYSLGNFVSNQRRRYCDGGIAATIKVVCPPGQRPRFKAEAIPLWVRVPGYRILPPAAADTVRLDPASRHAWELFRNDTHNLLRDSGYR